LGGAWGAKVQKVPKLAKHILKQRKTTTIVGGANSLSLDPLLTREYLILNRVEKIGGDG